MTLIFTARIGLLFCVLFESFTQATQPGLVSSSQDTSSAEEIVLPKPTGPYRVGRTSFHRIDTSRPEPFTEDSTDHRQVLFQIWYPAEPVGGSPASYINVAPGDDIFRRSYAFVGIDQLVKVRAHASPAWEFTVPKNNIR